MRKRIAFFSPLKPDKSAVADYSEKLLPELSRSYDIDVFGWKTTPSTPSIKTEFNWFTRRDYEIQRRRVRYDLNVYQIGNSHYHNFIWPVLARYPGAVILHDANIHHARAFYHLNLRRPEDYVRELTWCHGASGDRVGPAIANGYHSPVLYDMFPMLKLVSESAKGVLVHNQFAFERITDIMDRNRVFRITLPFSDIHLPPYSQARKMLGIKDHEIIVASFGYITPEKRIEIALKAFEIFQKEYANSRYVLVGDCIEDDYSRWLQTRIQNVPNVRVTGYVEESEFKAWLAASDICIALRYPTQGESSDALLRIMGAGKPAIVPAYRQFLEIPDSACVHVPLWPNEVFSVLTALRQMADNPLMSGNTGKNARKHVLQHHSVKKWIESVTEGLEKTMELPDIQSLATRCRLRHIRTTPVEEGIGLKLSHWGSSGQNDMIVQPLARAMRELGISE